MQALIELIDAIPTHKAFNNDFYLKWTSNPLPIEHIAIFARNYWEFSWNFPKTLALLIANVSDLSARVEYTKILFSELGQGKYLKTHTKLFEKFISDLTQRMKAGDSLLIRNLIKNSSILEETKALIEGEKELYSKCPSIGAGAQLALECQAYSMISLLYEGARNYKHLWNNQDSFHESCEFFYVHIGSVEKDHREEAITAVNSIIKTEEDLKHAIYGFNTHLDLFADFWNALSKVIEN